MLVPIWLSSELILLPQNYIVYLANNPVLKAWEQHFCPTNLRTIFQGAVPCLFVTYENATTIQAAVTIGGFFAFIYAYNVHILNSSKLLFLSEYLSSVHITVLRTGIMDTNDLNTLTESDFEIEQATEEYEFNRDKPGATILWFGKHENENLCFNMVDPG